MLKLTDLQAGDVVTTDGGFTCLPPGQHTVFKDTNGLYVKCGKGRHYLDGQKDRSGNLVGISRPVPQNEAGNQETNVYETAAKHFIANAQDCGSAEDALRWTQAAVNLADLNAALKIQRGF